MGGGGCMTNPATPPESDAYGWLDEIIATAIYDGEESSDGCNWGATKIGSYDAAFTRAKQAIIRRIEEEVTRGRLDERELMSKAFYEADQNEEPIERIYAKHLDRINVLQSQLTPKEGKDE